MPNIQEAKDILKALGLPIPQQNEMSALTLIALCHLHPHQAWSEAVGKSTTVSKGIMSFVQQHYDRQYAPNTRETFRRQVLHQFVQAGVAAYNPDNPNLPTNSPHAHYALTASALEVVRRYGREDWSSLVNEFRRSRTNPDPLSPRDFPEALITLPDGSVKQLSPGAHNALQVAFIQYFVPIFTQDAVLLYLGDTADKDFYLAQDELVALGISISEHSKLPDIILYERARNWLYLAEIVTSHGPMTPKRISELNQLLEGCNAGKIFVTAFLDFPTFRKYVREIAWETEVWVAEFPEHLIHFNGQRFLGPYR